MIDKLLDFLLPWRVIGRDLRAVRDDLEATNRQLELLIQALEARVARNLV